MSITITRKIQLNFEVASKEDIKPAYDLVFGWQRIVHRAANWVATHHYIQENIKELFYLTEEVRVKLGSIEKDQDGILNTSRDNTTYQVLSKHFKGQAPMGMLSGLNMNIAKTYKKEAKDVRYGNKSLRTYRNTIPMPVRSADIRGIKKLDDGNYSFFVYGVTFRTFFGKDLSENEIIFDRAVAGEYKLCDSSLKLEKKGGKWKMFFLAVFSFEKEKIKVNPDKTAMCHLSMEYPLVIKEKKDRLFKIGTKEEYLHRRLAIQGALKRLQAACKYNVGGKGRTKKMQAIEKFKKLESNYIDTRMHLYSKLLIDYCIKNQIGKIALCNYQEVEDQTHEEGEQGKFLLANWSYYNLATKIKYKAEKFGIEVVEEVK